MHYQQKYKHIEVYRGTLGDSPYSIYGRNWPLNIRRMEQANAGLGLNDTINETTLLSEESNNIDVHMLKNTEYGAIVLFGASDYGKQGENKADRYMNTGATSGTEVQASSTGNRYGVYELGYYIDSSSTRKTDKYEWVAGGLDTAFSSNLPNIDNRYVDRYTTDSTLAKVGDATIETKGWQGNGSTSWLSGNNNLFQRGRGVSPFEYYAYNDIYPTGNKNYSEYQHNARASIVIGEGF